QCVSVVELLGRHPAALLDQHAPGPRQNPAEAAQRNEREGGTEFEQGGYWRGGNRRRWGRSRGDRLGHGKVLSRPPGGNQMIFRHGGYCAAFLSCASSSGWRTRTADLPRCPPLPPPEALTARRCDRGLWA